MPPVLSPSPQTPFRTSRDSGGRSPSYFGLAPDASGNSLSSTGVRYVQSSRSPSVRSAAAISPHTIPTSTDPKYETFRKQSESGFFSLSGSGFSTPPITKLTSRPSPTRSSSSRQDRRPLARPAQKPVLESEPIKHQPEHERSPKRLLSSDTAIFNRDKTASPESYLDSISPKPASLVSKLQDKSSRLSLSHPPAPVPSLGPRADTLPAALDHEGPVFVPPQCVVNILDSDDEDPLVLDLRVSTQYAKSRICGALNLCIPTTLLKRQSYNVKRLAETFKHESHRARFERWRQSSCIIVYDTSSSQSKDAANCLHVLKKFQSDGWTGRLLILRGGFVDFCRSFSSFVDEKQFGSANSSTSTLSLDSQSSLPPVIGGCPMPPTKSAANPFFGNIRQNMDLIGGVGRIPIKMPSSMSKQAIYDFPKWLRLATDENDQGNLVSDKFLHIEQIEQKRMQDALSETASARTPKSRGECKLVKIAGLEKGSKNRYNNIWPFEHTRVKLQEVPNGECDYVNASWAKTSFSNKRYIATQGPIPQTFADFWSMVWQTDVRVIVMLTAETEGGQLKAHNYWSDKSYGPLRLESLSEHRASLDLSKIHRHRSRQSLDHRHSSSSSASSGSYRRGDAQPSSDSQPFVIVRKFALSHEQHPFARMREITQLQYSSWPDFGAPTHPAHVLGLVEQCNTVVRSVQNNSTPGDAQFSTERPVLVHCSAGCGRTGTFCTVDSVVDMLKRQRSVKHKRQGSAIDADSSASRATSAADDWLQRDDIDLIERAVEEFRMQRISMVQSLRQFVLCYEAVVEWVAGEAVPKSA